MGRKGKVKEKTEMIKMVIVRVGKKGTRANVISCLPTSYFSLHVMSEVYPHLKLVCCPYFVVAQNRGHHLLYGSRILASRLIE